MAKKNVSTSTPVSGTIKYVHNDSTVDNTQMNNIMVQKLSFIEHSLNEIMLMMEQPLREVNSSWPTGGVNVNEAWEEQIRSAVITALRRHRNDPDGQIIVDAVIAILKGHNEDK